MARSFAHLAVAYCECSILFIVGVTLKLIYQYFVDRYRMTDVRKLASMQDAVIGAHAVERTVLYKTKSLDGTKP